MAAAWQGKELLRAVYAAVDVAAARAALDRFYHWADGVGVAELSRLARTVRAWEAEILAFHTTGGCSNGPTEAVNLLIKKVERVGHGFRSFVNYRLRLLLHCDVTGRLTKPRDCEGAPHACWRDGPVNPDESGRISPRHIDAISGQEMISTSRRDSRGPLTDSSATWPMPLT